MVHKALYGLFWPTSPPVLATFSIMLTLYLLYPLSYSSILLFLSFFFF